MLASCSCTCFVVADSTSGGDMLDFPAASRSSICPFPQGMKYEQQKSPPRPVRKYPMTCPKIPQSLSENQRGPVRNQTRLVRKSPMTCPKIPNDLSEKNQTPVRKSPSRNLVHIYGMPKGWGALDGWKLTCPKICQGQPGDFWTGKKDFGRAEAFEIWRTLGHTR
eukprot:9386112-Karenia_brevis.AAC.1